MKFKEITAYEMNTFMDALKQHPECIDDENIWQLNAPTEALDSEDLESYRLNTDLNQHILASKEKLMIIRYYAIGAVIKDKPWYYCDCYRYNNEESFEKGLAYFRRNYSSDKEQ